MLEGHDATILAQERLGASRRLDKQKSGLEVDQQRLQIGQCLGISNRDDFAVFHCVGECSVVPG